MTIDHDAIAAMVRCDLTLGLNICAAYLDLYDEVAKLRANLNHVIAERDATLALMLARAEQAEAERDALKSIANNTCCDGCQEAALVARQALKGDDR